MSRFYLNTEFIIVSLVFTLNALLGIWVYNEQFLLMLIFLSFVGLVHNSLASSVRSDATDRIKQMYASTVQTELKSLSLIISTYLYSCQLKFFILNYRKVLHVLALDLRWYFGSIFSSILKKALTSYFFKSTLVMGNLLTIGNTFKIQKEYSLLYYLNHKL